MTLCRRCLATDMPSRNALHVVYSRSVLCRSVRGALSPSAPVVVHPRAPPRRGSQRAASPTDRQAPALPHWPGRNRVLSLLSRRREATSVRRHPKDLKVLSSFPPVFPRL